MPSLLEKATKGRLAKPFFIMVYGTAGIGKSTFASRFPKSIFLALEDGTNQLDVSRLNPGSFQEVLQMLDELATMKHDYESVIIDSVDHLEIQIWDQVARENKVRSVGDMPYGAGYSQALAQWKIFVEKLKLIRNKMNVVLIAHSIIKQVNDPSLPQPYDRHVIKLNQKAADYLKESVEAVLFASYEVFVVKNDGAKSARAVGEGKRILSTMATPSAEGKNRYSLPPTLAFDYDEFIKAVHAANPDEPKKIETRIQHYLDQIKDPAIKEKAEAAFNKAKGSAEELKKIELRLSELVTVK